VVDSERIVLGIVNAEALSGDPATVVENIMKPDPVTFRPHLRTGEIPDYVRKRQVRHVLVTTSDGVLIGVLPDV
jgi:Mg/Co/Ni transporter MgtE